MGAVVKTITKCDRCGIEDTRDGAEASYPPVGWAEVLLAYRGEGRGWTNNTRTILWLCPQCAKKVKKVMKTL